MYDRLIERAGPHEETWILSMVLLADGKRCHLYKEVTVFFFWAHIWHWSGLTSNTAFGGNTIGSV